MTTHFIYILFISHVCRSVSGLLFQECLVILKTKASYLMNNGPWVIIQVIDVSYHIISITLRGFGFFFVQSSKRTKKTIICYVLQHVIGFGNPYLETETELIFVRNVWYSALIINHRIDDQHKKKIQFEKRGLTWNYPEQVLTSIILNSHFFVTNTSGFADCRLNKKSQRQQSK